MTARLSLLDRFKEWRNGLLTSRHFQRRATRTPLFRSIARRRVRGLFDLCAGFVYSQILLACVRLGLLELLAEGPQTVESASRRLALPAQATLRLLRAAASLGLAESRSRARYGLGQVGAAVLATPGLAAMIEHHALLYADLADPVALLRGAEGHSAMGRYWPYADSATPGSLAADQVSAYSRLMSASQSFVAEQLIDAYPLDGHRCLLDVGGGEGAFLAIAGARVPGLRMMLFDLPAVADRARQRLEAEGLGGRTQVFGGDFSTDALPSGADVVTLIRVIHDHDDERALAILRSVRAIVPPDGVLLLAEPMSGTRGAEPVGDAYFGFYLLAMGSGRTRRVEELRELLRTAGFERVSQLRTHVPLLTRLIVARP